MSDPGEGWWTDEEGYPQYLEAERHLFAWCLMRIGGFSEEAARYEALERYPYQPPEALYRGIIFHDEAWDWAMIRLFGHSYRAWPAIDPAIRAEYEREAEQWHQ
jgi:hypothetical protein